MSQRNVCYIVFSSRHRAQIDCTSSQTEHFHCWRQTLPLRGELFHPAAEKEIVRDVTEKRLLHRVFIATQSPNRLHELPDCAENCFIQPQRRRLFVMTQSSDRLRILTYELPDGIVIKAPTKQFHAGVVSQSVSRRKKPAESTTRLPLPS